MIEHPIPQNVTSYQFHLVGDMTLKQFLELAAGIVLAWVIWQLGLPQLFRVPLAARILKFKVGQFNLSDPTAGSIPATDLGQIKGAARGYYGSCTPDLVTEGRWGTGIGYCDFVIYRMGLLSVACSVV